MGGGRSVSWEVLESASPIPIFVEMQTLVTQRARVTKRLLIPGVIKKMPRG